MAGRVVVGYDATTASRRALLWAATDAERRGATLTVVVVVDSASLDSRRPSQLARSWRAAQDRGWQRATAGAVEARAVCRSLDVVPAAYVGAPASVLVSASRRADALVVGVGRRRSGSVAPGSVARSVVMRGYPPVILVGRPAPVPAGPAQRIVVGVDGSPEATRAVQAAAAVAAVWGAPLLLVCAVDPGDAGAGAGIGGHVRHDPVSVAEGGRIARAAEEHARSAAPGVPVTNEVVTGRAHAVLAQAGRDSGLVVVGRRGHGAERTLILGSVARALLRTVPAPLAVVSTHAHSREDVAPLRLVRSSRLAVPLGPRDGQAPRIPASQAVSGESA